LSTLRAGINDDAVFATDVFAAGGFSIFGDAGCASDMGIATGAAAGDTAVLAASTSMDAALGTETASATVPWPDPWPDACPAAWSAGRSRLNIFSIS
jgi:hypothetical protein